MIDEDKIKQAITHATSLRDKYRRADREQYKFWRQEVFRLESDLLRAQRINAALNG